MSLVQNLDDLLNLWSRRKLLVLVTAIVCTLLSTLLISKQQRVYRAYAAIQVEGPQIQTSGSDANTSGNSAQIMQSIENRLLTRENLLAMIDRHGFAKAEPGKSSDELVAELRKAIDIQTVADVASSFGSSAISSILITASTGDGELSARIANDLAQNILDMSNEGANSRARDTYAFFEGEEKRIRTEIVTLEADLADYQNKNTDRLPVLAEARRTEMQELDGELRALDQQSLEATSEMTRLKAQGVQREVDRRRLDELVAGLALIQEKATFAQKRRAEVEASLSLMPEVEQTIAAKKRELTLSQDRYASVSQNLANAETALFLAERQKSERFTLLDRAITPEYAAGVGSKKLVAASAFASLVVGLLVALAVELLHPIVRTSAQLERATGIRALGAIPEVRGLTRRTMLSSFNARREFYLWNLAALAGIAAIVLLISSGMR